MTDYKHTPEMGEISGFGGKYEDTCQAMLQQGCEWLSKKMKEGDSPELALLGTPQVYGILIPKSDDAKALEASIMKNINDCTGAMIHSVMIRMVFITKHGYEEYKKKMTEREKEETGE